MHVPLLLQDFFLHPHLFILKFELLCNLRQLLEFIRILPHQVRPVVLWLHAERQVERKNALAHLVEAHIARSDLLVTAHHFECAELRQIIVKRKAFIFVFYYAMAAGDGDVIDLDVLVGSAADRELCLGAVVLLDL